MHTLTTSFAQIVTGAFFALIFTAACGTAKSQPSTAQAPPQPAQVVAKPLFVSWDKKMVDLGTVKKGEKRTLAFEYTNMTKEDIQIEIVDACECTKVDFPRGPIAPGGKGRLDVTFDSTEKEAAETIGINIVFKNVGADGNPKIEVVEYKFDVLKY
jgi:peptidoglycan-associated lipoprotein